MHIWVPAEELRKSAWTVLPVYGDAIGKLVFVKHFNISAIIVYVQNASD